MITITPGVLIGTGVLFSSDSDSGAVLVMSLDAANYSGSGDWLDDTANGNDATLVGTPEYNA